MQMLSWRLLPYLTALIAGVLAGTIAHSAIVSGVGALVVIGVWSYVDRDASGPR